MKARIMTRQAAVLCSLDHCKISYHAVLDYLAAQVSVYQP
jgi:hypothetical protein